MDIAALILSIYSALLASFLGYLAWNREKHRVRVFAQPFMVVEEGKRIVTGVAITVVNSGVRSLTVQNIRFFAAEGSFPGVEYKEFRDEAKLPHRLQEHEQALFRYELNDYFDRLNYLVVETTAKNVTVEWNPVDATDTSRLTDLPGPKF